MDPIQMQIRKLQNLNVPYYPTTSTVKSVHTPVNHFPYTRFYQGDYRKKYVDIFDREAGWSPQNNDCYKNILRQTTSFPPDYCFQAPASIIYPCHRDNLEQHKCGYLNQTCNIGPIQKCGGGGRRLGNN